MKKRKFVGLSYYYENGGKKEYEKGRERGTKMAGRKDVVLIRRPTCSILERGTIILLLSISRQTNTIKNITKPEIMCSTECVTFDAKEYYPI